MGSPRFHLRLLGPPRVESVEGEDLGLPSGKPLALLAYIALAPEPPARDELAVLLWPDVSRRRARGSLRQALWQLRRHLGDDAFASDDPVQLKEDLLTTDVDVFREHVAGGRLDDAVALWNEPPLDQLHLPDAPEWARWADGLRRELEQRLGGALSDRGNRAREMGAGHEAVRWLRLARSVQPFRLQHHLDLAEALLDLRAFDDATAALAESRQAFEDPDALERLASMEERLREVRRGAAGAPPEPGAGIRLHFTGRTEEFQSLVRRWRQVREGDTGVALILGEAGIGKTRLAEEVAHLARSEGARIVKVKAEDTERPIEWGLLGEVVDTLLRLSGAAGIASGSEDMLRTLVPSLPRSEGAGTRGENAPLALPRTRPSAALSDALQDLIAAVAEDAPLLLVVDDLQWADVESRAVLTRVATRTRETPVYFLATSRTGAGEVSGRMRKTLALLSEAAGDTALQLQPLSGEETRELLAKTVRAKDGSPVERVVERIIRTSRGNPLFIVELLKVLRDEGIVQEEEDGTWTIQREVPADLPLPASLRELIDRQLSNLSQEASLVAAHLARARYPVAPRVLASRAGLSPSALTSGVAELVQRRMVHWETGEKLAFAHDELRSAVSRRFQLHVGLTTGGGAQWSLFRTAVAASLALLLLSGAAYLATGGSFPSAPALGGGPLVVVHGPDSVLEARGQFNTPAGTWRFQSISQDAPRRLGRSRGGGNAGRGEHHTRPLPSPGRTRILHLTQTETGEDSALVVRPDGSHVDTRTWERIHGASWCGGTVPALLVSAQAGGATGLFHWRPDEGTAAPVPVPGLPGSVLACAPDGRFAAVLAAERGELSVQVLDLRSGSAAPLPVEHAYRVRELRWPADRPEPVPAAVRILDPADVELDWGERHPLHAELEFSNGSTAIRGLVWSSRNPTVASVSTDGVITANRPGVTTVLVSHDGWLADSVIVRVRETEEAPRVLLWDPVPPLGDDIWQSPGGSPPLDLSAPAASAASWGDAAGGAPESWRSIDAFALPAGGTLETEFILAGDGPPIRVCLVRYTRPRDGASSDGRSDAALCATIEGTGDGARGSLHFHPSFPPLTFPAPVTSGEAGGRWRHLGLGLLPDGTGVAFLDRVEVARTPARLPLDETGRWHVFLQGLQMRFEGEHPGRGLRNVLLWPDVRF